MMINAWWLLPAVLAGLAAGWWLRIYRGPPRDAKGKFTAG